MKPRPGHCFSTDQKIAAISIFDVPRYAAAGFPLHNGGDGAQHQKPLSVSSPQPECTFLRADHCASELFGFRSMLMNMAAAVKTFFIRLCSAEKRQLDQRAAPPFEMPIENRGQSLRLLLDVTRLPLRLVLWHSKLHSSPDSLCVSKALPAHAAPESLGARRPDSLFKW